jgi:hypothetical protein
MRSGKIVRRSRAIRQHVSAPRFSEEYQEILAQFRHDCLAQRSPEDVAAAEALGLAAMQTIKLNQAQIHFLRGLVTRMGAPEHCGFATCRTHGGCMDEKIECYWRNRESVRASFPQVDDALLRLATRTQTPHSGSQPSKTT